MAKSTRGKKVKTLRKPRQPRQPKSASISAVSEEALRLQLFSCLYDRERTIEEVISNVDKLFNYIKYGLGAEVNAGPKPLRKVVKSVQPEAPPQPDVEVVTVPPIISQEDPTYKKSRFEENRILM